MHFTLIRQNWTHALRRELGYPDGTPLLHTLAFATGPTLDDALGVEVAQVATDMGRDVVISSWGGIDDDAPQGIGLALREAGGGCAGSRRATYGHAMRVRRSRSSLPPAITITPWASVAGSRSAPGDLPGQTRGDAAPLPGSRAPPRCSTTCFRATTA